MVIFDMAELNFGCVKLAPGFIVPAIDGGFATARIVIF